MGYEFRGNRRHYYAKVRDGRTVRSHHVGKGLARHFGRLDEYRDAHAERLQRQRAPIEGPAEELKLFCRDAGTLRAGLLYAVGFYRQSGTWRWRSRARLFQRGAEEVITSGPPFDLFGRSETPVGAASGAGLELRDALEPAPVDLSGGRLDQELTPREERAFEHLGAVVGLLDRREALPGDLWVLRFVSPGPLFEDLRRRRSELEQILLERVSFDRKVQRELPRMASVACGWDEEVPYGGGYTLSLARAEAELCALDVLSRRYYRAEYADTYTKKQWAKEEKAALARLHRALMHLRDVMGGGAPHLRALVDAGDCVEIDGILGNIEPRW